MTLKLRVPVPFPANVTGSGGIGVVKANGDWTISPDFASLATIVATAVTDPSTKQIWLYDPTSITYNVLTLSGLGDALYKTTSTTSLAIGTGSKVFTIASGKDFTVGDYVLATSNADPTNFMVGQITAYSGTTLTINVPASNFIGGSGTHADWTIRLSAANASTVSGYLATSSTSNTIANSGSKSFTVASGLSYSAGVRVRATETGLTAWMEGVVSAYSGTTLTFTADKKFGSGTFTAWDLNVTGEPGAGDLTSTNNLSDVANVATSRANLGVTAQIAMLHHANLGGL